MDFYTMPVSAPARAALLTASHLGLELNIKELDLFAGEQMKPEFVAINPQHCVPTLVDGDLTLWESRAISGYFVNQYGKDDSLYPKCPKKRALVDKMLYFDMGTLYDRFAKYAYPVMFSGAEVDPAKLEKLQEALGYLNGFLEGQEYATGDVITIADHALAASVSTFKAGGIDLAPHANVTAWLERCEKNIPGYAEANQAGADAFGAMAKAKLQPAEE